MDLNEIINRPMVDMPSGKFGTAEVDWYDTEAGVVMDVWGEDADREVAAALQVTALNYYGHRLTHYDFERMEKTADWNDIMEKAKRLIQGNAVVLLRNGYTNIVATVKGDHGQYEVEIGRQDPASRVITNWHCQCPWAQFSFDRTRKWKKYEQRPCSHVLATYWKSLGTPLDEDADDQGGQPPASGPAAPPAPSGGPPPSGGPGGGGEAPIGVRAPAMPPSGPRTFLPSGEMLPAEGQGELPGMPQAAPPIQQPAQKGVIPPFPGEQMQLWQQWQGPGTTDGGQPSPPWAVSVPGAKPATPFNPLQSPGTYSKVVWAGEYQPDQQVQLLEDEYMITSQPGGGDYVLVTARRPDGSPRVGTVRGQDDQTGWVEVMFSMDESGPGQPRFATGYLDPSQIKPSQMLPPGQTGPRRVYK